MDSTTPPVTPVPSSSPSVSDTPALTRRGLLRGSALAATMTAALVGVPGVAQAVVPPPTRDGAVGRGISGPSGVVLTGAAWFGGQVIAVGTPSSGGPAVAVRTAGRPWRLLAAPAQAADLTAVGVHGSTVTAVGSRATSDVPGGTAPAIVASRDGTTWRSADVPLLPGVLTAVASDGNRLLAVGALLDGETAEGAGALVLGSTDGRTWRRLPATGLPHGGETTLTAVTHHAGRWIVAASSVGGASLWQSVDGRSWTTAAAPATRGVVISALASSAAWTVAAGSTLVAAGSALVDGSPLVWRQTGRGTWARLRPPAGLGVSGVPRAFLALAPDAAERTTATYLLATRHGGPTTVIAEVDHSSTGTVRPGHTVPDSRPGRG